MGLRFSIVDLPAKPAKPKSPLDIGNSVRYPPAEVRPRPRKRCINFFAKNFFLRNS